MLTNCFRFAPRDSVPGLIAKICKYLKDHPGWSEEELKEQIKHFIGQTGVESFNGRTGAVVLNEDDVNNLKIESAYFAEGDETIDELDLVALYNQGVRFVFTNWNSVTSGYDLSFVLDYFGGSNDVVYYPMAIGSGGGDIVSVNGKTGIVELSLSDILGDSGAQVKLCTATEFTSNTIATWNAYYEDGYRIVGVVNYDASAIDYIYLLRQDENNHQPIGISYDASDAYTPTNPPPYPVTSVNGDTGEVFTLRVDPSDPGVPTDIPAPINATTLNGKDAGYYATAESVNKISEKIDDIGTQEEIVQQVIAALGTPVFGSVDENKHITLSGHLADGTYTIRFEDTDGFASEVCTITKAPAPTYVNLFDPATAKLNTRMSGSSSVPKAQDGYVMTASIPIPATVVGSSVSDSDSYVAVQSKYWSGSANIFYDGGNGRNYADCNITKGTVVGDWVKIPIKGQWVNSITATSMVVSLYVKASAITAADIQDIEIYVNEYPE